MTDRPLRVRLKIPATNAYLQMGGELLQRDAPAVVFVNRLKRFS